MDIKAELIISRNISINLSSIPYQLGENIRKRLTIPNPLYAKHKKMGYWAGNIQKEIKLWKNHDNWLVLPRGFKNSLLKELKNFNIPYIIKDYRILTEPAHFISHITLRPYQIAAVEHSIKQGQGIIEAPCGSGKTVIGLELIARCNQTSLWLVHTMELARQAMERISQFLNIPEDEIGFFGNGLWKKGNKISVGMVQTLASKKLETDFIKHFGLVILDEAHHSPASTFTKVLTQFPAYYRFGLTATPFRGDGLGLIMYYQIGYTTYKITQHDLSAEGNLITPVFKRIDTDFYYDYQDDFTSMINAIVNNKKRNELIIRVLLEEVKNNHHCLILSDRVDHCHVLCDLLKEIYPEGKCAVLTGELPKKERNKIVDLVNSGELNAVFATSKLAEEGLDWKILDRLFLTCPTRSKGKIQQAVGRIQRPYKGKEDARVFDFVDSRVDILESQYKSRFFGVYEPMSMLNSEE